MTERLFDDIERERYITRAQVMQQLNEPLNHGVYPTGVMTRENSCATPLNLLLDAELSDWTNDILDAFRVDPATWSQRIVDTETGRHIDPDKAACICGDIGEVLRTFALQNLQKSARDGYSEGKSGFRLDLDGHVHVEFYGGGSLWLEGNGADYELEYEATFYRVA